MHIPQPFISELTKISQPLFNEPLKKYTTFKTGGPADIFVKPGGKGELKSIVELVSAYGIPRTIIAGGSNLLVSDNGIDGIVICLNDIGGGMDGMSIPDKGVIHAGAGASKADFVEYCLRHELGGIEFMAGIPGTIGGGIYMNAGTTMGAFADVVEEVELMDRTGKVSSLMVDKNMAGYRTFPIPHESIILGAHFALPVIERPDKLRDEIKAILKDRESKHPLEYPSAGSVFKNPPGYASWQLVQNVGLKGKRIGGAMISEKHTNFIINYGNAASQDILNLINLVKEKVHTQYGIDLEAEIRILGDFF